MLIKLEAGKNLIKKVKNSYEKNFAVGVKKVSKIDNKSGGDRVTTYLRAPSKCCDVKISQLIFGKSRCTGRSKRQLMLSLCF